MKCTAFFGDDEKTFALTTPRIAVTDRRQGARQFIFEIGVRNQKRHLNSNETNLAMNKHKVKIRLKFNCFFITT